MSLDRSTLIRRIDQALGREPADLVVRNARILNTASGSVDQGDIAICGHWIVGTHDRYHGRREIDAGGRIAAPGFIDTHVHVESSMVLPAEFERQVLPLGTTTAICDPHEIANVLGSEGIRYFLDASTSLAMTLKVNLSSCVPSSDLETSGARLLARDLVALRDHPAVIGLAELMSYPGVFAHDPVLLDKLIAFDGYHIDGHAPLVGGRELNAYLACAVRTDHEAISFEEAREKLKKGMIVLAREGSVAKNVAALAPLLTADTWPFMALCTDDRNPLEIREEGHIDFALRKAIAHGAAPIPAYRAASLSAARAFGLTDRGVIAPGWRADIVLVDDLESVAVSQVICGGRLVNAELLEERSHPAPVGRNSVQRTPVTASDFRAPTPGPTGPVIGVAPMSLITEHLTLELPYSNSERHADPERSVHKAAVLERHGVNGNIGVGFVHGFGAMRGAIAVSVGHDSHNLTVVGANDDDMALAINRVITLQGGSVAVRDGQVLAELALPIAGLMSEDSASSIADALLDLRTACRTMGCELDEPLLQMAFLPLPVIPHLKLTDRGLVDVDRFQLISG